MKLFYRPTLILIICLFTTNLISQNVGINVTGAAPAATNMLEILQPSTSNLSTALYTSSTGAITGSGYGIWIRSNCAATVQNVGGYFNAWGTSPSNIGVTSEVFSNGTGTGSATAGAFYATASAAGETSIAVAAYGNSNTSSTTYGIYSRPTGLIGTGTCVAGYFSSPSATNKYAIVVPSNGGNVGIGTETPSSTVLLDMGTAGTLGGSIRMAGSTSGNITIKPAAAAGTYTLTLPNGTGTANQALLTDGSGGLSWGTPAGGISGSGTSGYIPKFTGTSSVGNSQITDDGSTVSLGGIVDIANTLELSTVVNALITSNQTNYSIGGGVMQYISANAGMNIEGILHSGGNATGKILIIYNTGSNSITIKNNSASCTATNRIQMMANANLTFAQFQCIILIYDGGFAGGARWRQIQ